MASPAWNPRVPSHCPGNTWLPLHHSLPPTLFFCTSHTKMTCALSYESSCLLALGLCSPLPKPGVPCPASSHGFSVSSFCSWLKHHLLRGTGRDDPLHEASLYPHHSPRLHLRLSFQVSASTVILICPAWRLSAHESVGSRRGKATLLPSPKPLRVRPKKIHIFYPKLTGGGSRMSPPTCSVGCSARSRARDVQRAVRDGLRYSLELRDSFLLASRVPR